MLTEDQMALPDVNKSEVAHRTKAEVIYHYTTLGTFEGILPSREIWATDVHFTNDASEATHGISKFASFANTRIQAALERGEADDMREAIFAQQAVDLLMELKVQQVVYIACFSKQADLLSQWQSYAREEGVSIGFDSEALWNLRVRMEPARISVLSDVFYAQEDKEHLVSSVYNEAFEKDDPLYFASWALMLAPSFKHAGFSQEQEVRWRVLLTKDNASIPGVLKYRSTKAGLKPYIAIPLADPSDKSSPLPIRDVIMGPTNPAEACHKVKQLLLRHGLDIEPRCSGIPLRL